MGPLLSHHVLMVRLVIGSGTASLGGWDFGGGGGCGAALAVCLFGFERAAVPACYDVSSRRYIQLPRTFMHTGSQQGRERERERGREARDQEGRGGGGISERGECGTKGKGKERE